ncbi:hypothetical protein [Halobiforma nitratireducens]|uniref:Uncharacterized protein n=1 Tax=Halobiforma nitratireducens JCM 10879 TaxID=1227454 RepID=M0MHQ7_9EURY|nr:hypothetical protein [Halobiforma nitratireducens]EMA45236.1 hypothetical protein C446_02482 [Halobiforma nitratireducens JCM 10879]
MFLWLTLAIVLAVTIAYARWGAIPTPVPKTVLDVLPTPGSSPGLWLWRTFLLAVLVVAFWTTFAINPTGFVAYALAGILVWAVLDDIRQAMSDIWHGRIWWVDP